MAKYPYHVKVLETKTTVEVDGSKKKESKWEVKARAESLNEARKLASPYNNRDREDVRIERVNGRLIEYTGKL